MRCRHDEHVALLRLRPAQAAVHTAKRELRCRFGSARSLLRSQPDGRPWHLRGTGHGCRDAAVPTSTCARATTAAAAAAAATALSGRTLAGSRASETGAFECRSHCIRNLVFHRSQQRSRCTLSGVARRRTRSVWRYVCRSVSNVRGLLLDSTRSRCRPGRDT